MSVLTVPRGIRDLTPEWLEAALASSADGARITDLVAIPIAAGDVAELVRLVPTWDRPTSAPASVVAKVPLSDPVGRFTGFATRTFEREAAFYNELASTVWVSRPTCYVAHYDLRLEGYVVLLEDMLPAGSGDPLAGCSPEEAASVMPELAALHSPRWGDSALLGTGWLDQPTSAAVRAAAELVPNLFSGFRRPLRKSPGPGSTPPDASSLMGVLDTYLVDRPGPWTVLHGDVRLDNLLFGRPRVTVVDWHTVKIGPPLADVSYFIGSALWPEVRRDYECKLVRTYHHHLGHGGVELDWDECWDGYRRYSFDGLVMAIASAP